MSVLRERCQEFKDDAEEGERKAERRGENMQLVLTGGREGW